VLFFDEVTELSLAAQAKILHVLQERVVHRLGNPAPIECNVRLIAASARDLDQALRSETLREDFYYRLNVVSIRMPALRERLQDLPLLIDALAAEQARELGGEAVRFDAGVIARLESYAWPGNVRELRNYIERCHILMPGERMTVDNMLPPDQSTVQSGPAQPAAPARSDDPLLHETDSFHDAREAFERAFLLQHLERHGWNISRTAAEIGIERSQLHRKIKSFGLTQPAREQR
jgi:two-component system nitrogen regulation response regulator NtrX